MFAYPQAPESIGKVLDSIFRLYAATFWKVVWIAAGYAVLAAIPGVIAPAVPEDDPQLALAAVMQLVWMVPLFVVFAAFFFAIIYYRMNAVVTGGDVSLGTALRVGLVKIVPIIVASLLYVLALVLGTVALIVPGILFGLSLYFFMPLIVIDNEGIFASLKLSHRLVWGNWWRTLAVVSIPMFVVFALYMIVGIVVAITAGVSGYLDAVDGSTAPLESSMTFVLAHFVINVIVTTVTTPLYCAIGLVQLHDLKLRREGADLEARLEG